MMLHPFQEIYAIMQEYKISINDLIIDYIKNYKDALEKEQIKTNSLNRILVDCYVSNRVPTKEEINKGLGDDMNSEILSIDTVQKMSNLEKENKELREAIKEIKYQIDQYVPGYDDFNAMFRERINKEINKFIKEKK